MNFDLEPLRSSRVSERIMHAMPGFWIAPKQPYRPGHSLQLRAEERFFAPVTRSSVIASRRRSTSHACTSNR